MVPPVNKTLMCISTVKGDIREKIYLQDLG